MRAANNILRLTALIFLAFGLFGLFFPARLLVAVGVLLPVPAAMAEIRSFYGGLEIGFGIFLLASSRVPAYRAPAALAAASALGGVALGRLFGFIVDGPTLLAYHASGAMELLGAALNLWAFRRLRASA